MAVNYNDERFLTVESERDQALADLNRTYDTIIGESDEYYQSQIDASKQWAETQKQNQQAQTDLAIQQIEQQKEQAQRDYLKEQSGAYVDWQKQSGDYGVNAEKQAAAGMTNTGYAESSQVSMYNTYQNRVAAARQSVNDAFVTYNNAIAEAKLQNNSLLAEIAYQALQKQLELSLQGFQYKNELLLQQSARQQEIDQMYYSRYQDVLAQINQENALAEEIRQFNAQMAFQREQFAWEQEQAKATQQSINNASVVTGKTVLNPSKVLQDATPALRNGSKSGTVTNRTGSGWIEINGSRWSTAEFEQMYTSGKVKKVTNKDGSITYKKA